MVLAPIPLLQLPPAAAPTEFYRELSERVRALRLDLGIKSKRTARAAGMNPAGYSNFENGKARISAATFRKLQLFFGCPHDPVGETP